MQGPVLGGVETWKDWIWYQKAAMFMLRDVESAGKLNQKKSGGYQDY